MKTPQPKIKVYFSDFFEISPKSLTDFGALNISLLNDMPAFIDPFLLFGSKKVKYKKLHDEIIKYVRFLKSKAQKGSLPEGLLKAWFYFPEVKETWLGYSKTGNSGRGLGKKFALSLEENLRDVFTNFGEEEISQGSHLEKLCLIKGGIGRDYISDFTTNLIKGFLAKYTEDFSKKHLNNKFRKVFSLSKVNFNYKTEVWSQKQFELPYFNNEYVLLIPKDLLTKDETWINKNDLIKDFESLAESVPNDQLREQINNYFFNQLPDRPTKEEYEKAVNKALRQYPSILDFYISGKEKDREKAKGLSSKKIKELEGIFYEAVISLFDLLKDKTEFYQTNVSSYGEAKRRVNFLKDVIENKDGYRIFFHNGKAIRKESDLQILFKFTWFATEYDFNCEVNNGRGPVDFKVSYGANDNAIVEFKLAKSTSLKKNLESQIEIYKKANNTESAIVVILFFDSKEQSRAEIILRELELENHPNIILIDATPNKPSASKAKEKIERTL